MKSFMRVMVIAAAALMAGVAPASAGDGGPHGKAFHASIDGFESGFVPGPNPGRCPAGTEWVFLTEGGGSAVGYGDFAYSSEHCSRIVTFTPAGAVGKLAAGELRLTFDGTDDELYISYRGTWKFDGDLTTGAGIAKVHQSYEVTGGTGMFAGASGHGHMGGVVDFGRVLMDLDGGLHLAD